MALLPWRSSKSTFCCSGFHFAYDQMDERAVFSIVPRHSPKFGPYFELTFHALDPEHRGSLLNTPFKVTVESKQVIKLCPYCGVDLRRFYANNTAITWRESSLGTTEAAPEGP